MGDPLNPRDTFTTEEGVLANMWALEALLELLDRILVRLVARSCAKE